MSNQPRNPSPDPSRPSDLRTTPRHGRISSRTVVQPVTPQCRPYPAGPTSPPQGHRPVPQLRRDRDQPPNDLQRFSGLSVEPFCRWAFMVVDGRGREQPNHNHGNDVQAAIWVSETIDTFDNDPRLIHELILRIADHELGHEAFEDIRQNRAMVEILIYRHYQRHGGLMLPPTAPGVQALQDHQRAVREAQEECLRRTGRPLHPDNYPRIRFPAWRQPPGHQSGPASSKYQSGMGPTYGRGDPNPWGAPGDGKPRGPHGGGASGGGINV